MKYPFKNNPKNYYNLFKVAPKQVIFFSFLHFGNNNTYLLSSKFAY